MKNIKLNWKSTSIIQSLLIALFLFVSFTNKPAADIPVPVVAVAAQKMNVFYIGMDNPITVAASNVDPARLQVTGNNVKVESTGRGRYNVQASTPGLTKIIVNGDQMDEQIFNFRVKRIPDPVLRLGTRNGGSIGNGEFKAQGGIRAVIENFDINATCRINSYELTRVAKDEDPVMSVNREARFNANSQRLIDLAKPGDTYYFDNIVITCPGDQTGRKLGSMVFKIR